MEETAEANLKNQNIEYFLPRFTCGKREDFDPKSSIEEFWNNYESMIINNHQDY